tara:strand:+ start:69 stop:347 length:279 start_codon:yes stop_codon:yes gene_type:complete
MNKTHNQIRESIVHTYNAIQADNLIKLAHKLLPVEEYKRMLNILQFSTSLNAAITPSVAEYMILDLLSKHNTQIQKEFEMFFAFTKNQHEFV